MAEPPLIAFLTARLDEDEERALYADDDGPWRAATDVGDQVNSGVVVVGGEGYHWDTMIAACGDEWSDNGESRATHIARHDPARVLAEVAAKRRIIDLHADINDGDCSVCVRGQWGYPTHGGSTPELWPCLTLRLLALPFAGHPDYQEAWRPE